MSDRPSSSAERLTHWDGIYGRTKAEAVGWYQSEPVVSLAFIGSLGVAPEAGIVDVGGGASTLVDRLVSKGFSDLTVLDISPAALHAPRQRLGPDAPVAWLVGDILEWEPASRLLEWNLGDGWDPICERLEVPVPAEPFPVTNSTDEFREMVGIPPLT